MQVDYIIIGQGICGTWLSYYLLLANKSIVVFDKQNMRSASNVASGLINPVTGRRVVTTWLAEELLPFAWNEYNELGNTLNTVCISQKNILVFPAATDLQQAFREKMQQQNTFIKTPSVDRENLYQTFNFPFDVFEINPCYVVNMQSLLQSFRNFLQVRNILKDEFFNEDELIHTAASIQYKTIQAQKIIYADGLQSSQSKYWRNLPFVQNKGQALIVKIEGLNTDYVYKFGHLTLVSIEENVWWAGSSNELDFTTTAPTENFKVRTIASLKAILKKEFDVADHWAGLRPATVERRPFVGFHPLYPDIGILNGMGSKGCSLAPWFAKQLTQHLLFNMPLDALSDVRRFAKVLSK